MNTSVSGNPGKNLRQLPSVDAVLKQATALVKEYGHDLVTVKIQLLLRSRRESMLAGNESEADSTTITLEILNQLRLALEQDSQSSLMPVFNLTGTILHTNLGRAVLPRCALDAVAAAASDPVNLEFDLQNGERGERDSHFESLVCELTGAEAATAVNNNAAAVLLVLNTLALGKEVPVSRGELVEIGGSFRIPEIMERSDCTLVEVGATNRTHLKDYEKAINDNTALLLKVHTSNYRIEGFTAEVTEAELAALASKNKVPFVMDMGSGCLVDLAQYGLPAEPTAAQAIASGVDLITFSGDKLLGGPQCGIIAGKKSLIDEIRNNPLKRALRLDKMTLAALVAVLNLYRNPAALLQELPAMRQLTRSVGDIHAQAERLCSPIQDALGAGYKVLIEATDSQIGSGALPVKNIPSTALVISPLSGKDKALRDLEQAFRRLPKPVIGRIHRGAYWLDFRCLEPVAEQNFIEQLSSLDLLNGIEPKSSLEPINSLEALLK